MSQSINLVSGIIALAAITGTAVAQQATERAKKKTQAARLNVETDPPYGRYIVDAQGKTLYMFTTDQPDKSTCYETCARMWPPLTTTGSPQAAARSLDPEKLGTITRRDGTKQVTYAGWPLYYYVRDTPQNEVTGQDIHSFGGEWYLLSPDGEIIKQTARTSKSDEDAK